MGWTVADWGWGKLLSFWLGKQIADLPILSTPMLWLAGLLMVIAHTLDVGAAMAEDQAHTI